MSRKSKLFVPVAFCLGLVLSITAVFAWDSMSVSLICDGSCYVNSFCVGDSCGANCAWRSDCTLVRSSLHIVYCDVGKAYSDMDFQWDCDGDGVADCFSRYIEAGDAPGACS